MHYSEDAPVPYSFNEPFASFCFMHMSVLPACTSVHHLRSEKNVKSFNMELQMAVSHHMGAENRSQVHWGVASAPSHLAVFPYQDSFLWLHMALTLFVYMA